MHIYDLLTLSYHILYNTVPCIELEQVNSWMKWNQENNSKLTKKKKDWKTEE